MKRLMIILISFAITLGSVVLARTVVRDSINLVRHWFPDYTPEDVEYSRLRSESIAAFNRLNHLEITGASESSIEVAEQEWSLLIEQLYSLRQEIQRRYGRLPIYINSTTQ